MRVINFMDTTLRDAHQSLLATRMKTSEMLPVLEEMDEIGYEAFEMWGGATFDSCLRYLNEDPWERLKEIRKRVKKTKLQMLLRGQNILGYSNYPDDVLELFIKKMGEDGIDVVRIFDALNDSRNLEKPVEYAKKYGMNVQGAISYTVSPVHTIEKYVEFAKSLVDMGVDSLCIKDMAGLLTAPQSYKLVKALKKKFNLPIEVHSHFTSGLADAAYWAAIEAGADIIDTATSALAYGTSQPAVEPFVMMIKDSEEYETKLNMEKINHVNDHFIKVRANHRSEDVAMTSIDSRIFSAQVPGGMLSNLVSQLKAQNALDRYDEVMKEIPKVREDLGFPPLVTPTSQIVGVQAVLNVLNGERYKMVTKETKNYVKGMYGKPPAPISKEIIKKILGNEKPIDVRPADLLEPGLEKARKEIGELAQNDEDLLSYALFPQISRPFLEKKYIAKIKVDFKIADDYSSKFPELSIYPV
ncbi:MAG TPA: pyruvate carboxylase subunit B [Mesoaciditoga lauensis]|nr:pyruvate carboxylase subunit B [Mesoaciditoga lauensis]